MKKKLILFLPQKWVLAHREDELLPIEALARLLEKEFSGRVELLEKSVTDLTVAVAPTENVDRLGDEISTAFAKIYPGEEEAKNILVFEDDSAEAAAASTATPSAPETPSAPGTPAAPTAEAPATTTWSLDALNSALGGSTAAATASDLSEEEKKAQLDKCMEQILGTVGAADFKALARELCAVAPEIRRDGTASPFFRRVYLAAVNEGCGHATYLTQLAALLSALELGNVSAVPVERELGEPEGENMHPFEGVLDFLSRESNGKNIRILSIDISKWIDAVNTSPFRRFLSLLSEASTGKLIYVFRVPFVDKEILDSLAAVLNDRFCVRVVSVPPFTREELQDCAKRELENYGFTLTAPAWDCFHARIIQEKSDGRFYGIDTVKKVVWEIIYDKQLSNARRGVAEKSITKKDLATLCQTEQDNRLTGKQMLDALIGADSIKEKIGEIVSQILLARETEGMERPCIHMRFLGNPGTGKTTVARIIGKILKEAGVLRVGNFYEVAGRDLCGRYIGETAPKTASICRDAYGSVLFIDEAYSLYRSDDAGRDYGREALDTLIAEMENHRDDMVVIMAGYTAEMEQLMRGNPGIASRMPYVIDFPNFTREQLCDIYESMLKKRIRYDDTLIPAVREYFLSLPEEFLAAKDFSNARFVRNLFERTVAKAAMRAQLGGLGSLTLTRDDFARASADKEFVACMNTKKKTKIGFAE